MLFSERKIRKPLAIITDLNTDKKNVQEPLRVIKFVGNMKENIEEILKSITCVCGCQEFRDILMIFGEKIEKLRTERQIYKEKYFNDVKQLREEIKKLQEDIESVTQESGPSTQRLQLPLTAINQSQFNINIHQFPQQSHKVFSKITYDKQNAFSQDYSSKHIQSDHSEQQSGEQGSSSEEERQQQFETKMKRDKIYDCKSIEKMMRKYNIDISELEQMLEEYITEQQTNFDTEEQKRLYKLSRKLERSVWIKKVKNDVQVLTSAKNKARF